MMKLISILTIFVAGAWLLLAPVFNAVINIIGVYYV